MHRGTTSPSRFNMWCPMNAAHKTFIADVWPRHCLSILCCFDTCKYLGIIVILVSTFFSFYTKITGNWFQWCPRTKRGHHWCKPKLIKFLVWELFLPGIECMHMRVWIINIMDTGIVLPLWHLWYHRHFTTFTGPITDFMITHKVT